MARLDGAKLTVQELGSSAGMTSSTRSFFSSIVSLAVLRFLGSVHGLTWGNEWFRTSRCCVSVAKAV